VAVLLRVRVTCQDVKESTGQANRIQKALETAHIKLGDVAADALGASSWAMLKWLTRISDTTTSSGSPEASGSATTPAD
jgi:hypothetical protein